MKTERFSLWLLIKKWVSAFIDKCILFFTARFFGLGLALFLSFPHRNRMSHDNGIGGLGWLKIVNNPLFPPHDFFAPGRRFPVRIRHASATFLDDGMNCIRSISIKFSHHHFKSPFDIECNTSNLNLFWSAVSFLKFAKLRKQQWGVQYAEYYRKYPDGLKGAQKALRRDPSSFNNLHYYCLTPFLYVGTDNLKRYAKYRVLPNNDEPETGINSNPSDWDTCNQRALPHETNGRNFLKDEFVERVKAKGAVYRLQIQTRLANDDDDPEIFNNMNAWDENLFPWHNLATFEIEEALNWTESTKTSFSVNNMPKTLGILPAASVYDYNSLNYLRAHSEIARKARLLSYKFFGMVPPIPDNDNRNVAVWGE